ncbi:RHS repeat-associated core domain-containing protein [Pseudomonas azerbaijanoccidens]|jgi:RHS repeat-associated protein|uniref:RHS repeat-associated core domain-containing protein n=1 Tax=Pseudomonas azerbaijanoccidentalis TaxID=2842347 RepID=UPI00200A1D32|nr:RHS repeat-associated core domain-containing protein [Pseudomonas azerbaijanoccidentalis]MCK8666276.1 RHS repeat-associated core domain-containing protein [Pseudomonas azerbaijanoccidentalis]
MLANHRNLICYYHYDPLDRVIGHTPFGQTKSEFHYLKGRVTTEIQGLVQRSIMQSEDHLVAVQWRQSNNLDHSLLATDQQRSVLNALRSSGLNTLTYTPYGHRPPEDGLLSMLGFNGERSEPLTGYYLLGNGYRAFNPVLMRFNSPDSWSPFGRGGLNAYVYCIGDPINREDNSGRISARWLLVRKNIPQLAMVSRRARIDGVNPLNKNTTSSLSAPSFKSASLARAQVDSAKAQYPMPAAGEKLYTHSPEPSIQFGPENFRVNEVENYIKLVPRTLFHAARSGLSHNQTHLLAGAIENPALAAKLRSVATFNAFIKNFKKSDLHLKRLQTNAALNYLPSKLQQIIRKQELQ